MSLLKGQKFCDGCKKDFGKLYSLDIEFLDADVVIRLLYFQHLLFDNIISHPTNLKQREVYNKVFKKYFSIWNSKLEKDDIIKALYDVDGLLKELTMLYGFRIKYFSIRNKVIDFRKANLSIINFIECIHIDFGSRTELIKLVGNMNKLLK